MISAIVLVPDGQVADDVGHAREIVVRSLVWLVSAVVAGVVRDVTLAVPVGLGLAEVADQAGCALVEADREGDRLDQAVSGCRGTRILMLRSGFQPAPGLIEDIDSFVRRAPADATARVVAAPDTLLQRLFPDRARTVGLLLPREACRPGAGGFGALARAARRAPPLGTRASPIV